MSKTKTFKAPNGVYYTKALFFETSDPPRDYCLYTLKDQDHEGYPSLRRIYLELDDETEYLFAEKCFDGWPHFRKLLDCPWFVDYLSAWREELALRSSARALAQLKAKASSGDVSTNKYILEKGWDKSDKVGRPTKAAINQKAKEMFEDSGDILDDFKRISEGLSFKA